MKNKKSNWLKKIIVVIILGGVCMFGIHQFQEVQEDRRNREYEESLVQALKNSYRDIEEIKLSDPFYLSPPGNWNCQVELTFSDGVTVEYGLGHRLSTEINRSATDHPEKLEKLRAHFGETDKEVKVIYSDGREVVE